MLLMGACRIGKGTEAKRRMRLVFLTGLSLALGGLGCGAGPSGSSGVKSPRASQRPTPSMAPRAASPAPARKAVPSPAKNAVSRAASIKLASLWASRAALSCSVDMKIDQGATKGRLTGSIAWVGPSTQEPSGLISAQLSGMVGQDRCLVSLRSANNALLLETWQPKVQLSGMQQMPSSMVPGKIAGLRQLEVPMVQTLLATGCPTQLKMPGAQKAMWTLAQASTQRLAWEGPPGASQLLVLDSTGTLPVQRVVEFVDAEGAKVRWSIDLVCKSAG